MGKFNEGLAITWEFHEEISCYSVGNACVGFSCAIYCGLSTLGLTTCGGVLDGAESGIWAWNVAGKDWVLALELLGWHLCEDKKAGRNLWC
eukprot:3178649-Ditylum_brightwellii.AAC.1